MTISNINQIKRLEDFDPDTLKVTHIRVAQSSEGLIVAKLPVGFPEGAELVEGFLEGLYVRDYLKFKSRFLSAGQYKVISDEFNPEFGDKLYAIKHTDTGRLYIVTEQELEHPRFQKGLHFTYLKTYE